MISLKGSSKVGSQEAEINLAPIIDCFTVLITYSHLSASFISLGVLDVTVPSDSADTSSRIPTPINLTIALSEGGQIVVQQENQTNGKSIRKNYSIRPKEGTWDFDTLVSYLSTVHNQYTNLEGGILTADDSVAYQNIVKAIEKIKTVIPQVAISPDKVTL